MPVVTWQDKLGSTDGFEPVAKGGSAGVYWEDYNLPADHGAIEGATWEDYMAYDLTKVGLCGAMYMLKGWQMSRGACLEQLIAQNLNFKIIYEDAQ